MTKQQQTALNMAKF
ncbi:Rop family plasmid primer RNA-binding protein, partial [Klebsiella pneumoniae]|nr:Rop family plasmid primer RNA-binding protein [Klebsiella pneumoniae]